MIIKNVDMKFWYNELYQCCIAKSLLGLFGRFVRHEKYIALIYGIMDFLYTYAEVNVDHLVKNDFNASTCLIAGTLFENSSRELVSYNSKETNFLYFANLFIFFLYFE